MLEHYDAVIAGCGLSGAVCARYLAEEKGKKVLLLERRNHIGGNMYDYLNEDGILVHKYGPHTFHTNKKELYDYMCRFSDWKDYKLTCGAVIDGKYTPTPFNYQTIDDFFSVEKAECIKTALKREFKGRDHAPVVEMLNHPNEWIRRYAAFLFEKDYSLYTAKQWGISPQEIDPGVLKRVPVRFNYRIGYFDDKYQATPKISYTSFFECLLRHKNIEVRLDIEAKDIIALDGAEKKVRVYGTDFEGAIVYTGAVDELFGGKYGYLPYRSLRFEWRMEPRKSFQEAPVVAYPQADGYTRITEYTKLPVQEVGEKTAYAIEYPLPYKPGVKTEPYYPVLTEASKAVYAAYKKEAEAYRNLYLCGRLADFQYYNMDQALENALQVVRQID